MSLGLSIPPIVTALNPLVCPLLYDKVHYLVHRFVLNIPSFVVTSLVIGTAISWGRAGNIPRKIAAAVVLLLWARVFVISADGWLRDVRSTDLHERTPLLSEEVAGVDRVHQREDARRERRTERRIDELYAGCVLAREGRGGARPAREPQ